MRIRNIIKSRLFVLWVLSYIFISFFPIIIGSFVYIKSVETIHYEVNRMESMSLQQLKSIIDGKFDELDRTLSNISLNQDVKFLMSSQAPLEPEDILKIVNVQNFLSKFKLSNSNIEEIYIYLNNNDTIFSSVYKYNNHDIETVCNREFFLDYNQFINLADNKNYKYLRILKSVDSKGVYHNKVIIMQSMYLNSLSSPAATLIISLDGDKLINLLKNLELLDNGEVILVNSKNEFYSTGGANALPDWLNYDLLNESDMTFYNKWNDTKMAVTHLPSDVLDLEYISLVPSKVFLSKVQYIKNIIYTYIFICLVFGAIAAFSLTKWNFRHVDKLKQMLINALGKSENHDGNEFAFLEDSLKDLLDENKSIAAKLKQQKTAQCNNFLSRLLKGNIERLESIKQSLNLYEIYFKKGYFFVAAFSIEGPEHKLFEGTAEDASVISMIYITIKSIVEELSQKKHRIYMTEVDGMMELIINIEEMPDLDIDVFRLEICTMCKKAVAFVEKGFEITVSAFISDIHYDMQEIKNAYSEILQIAEYKTLIGDKTSILNYDVIRTDITDGFSDSYNLTKARLFSNCIAAGDYKSAREILDELLIRNLSNDTKSIQLIKCRIFGLINMTLEAIGEMRTVSDMDFIDSLNPVNRLLNTKSIIELKIQVDYIFNNIIEYYSSKADERIPDWIERAEEYIDAHLNEIDINITAVSYHIGISVSYVSRLYKKYRGIGLLDYIHKARIKKAKDLLRQDTNIKDVALQVGYLESKALIRSFKKYEGITPGRYKKTFLNKDEL